MGSHDTQVGPFQPEALLTQFTSANKESKGILERNSFSDFRFALHCTTVVSTFSACAHFPPMKRHFPKKKMKNNLKYEKVGNLRANLDCCEELHQSRVLGEWSSMIGCENLGFSLAGVYSTAGLLRWRALSVDEN